MKSRHSGLHRQKTILYYTFAVVLPGIFLGYMAFRGIRNDQALREKESRRKLEANSQAFFSAIDSGLVNYTNELTGDTLLSSEKKDDPSLLVYFARGAGSSLKIIRHKLLFLPAETLDNKAGQLNVPATSREGIRLEFSEKKLPEALRFYQDRIAKTIHLPEKIGAEVAVARLYNKMDQPSAAKACYNKIRTEYPEFLLNGQIPLSMIASLEILKINRLLGETNELKSNSLLYLDFLLHPPCKYDQTQFDYFYQSFRGIVPQGDRVTDSLLVELDARKARTEFLIRLISSPGLLQESGSVGTGNDRTGIKITPFTSGKLSVLHVSRIENDGIRKGLLIDFQTFLKSVSEIMIQNLDPDSTINLKIEDNAGGVIFSRVTREEPGYVSFPFPVHLPQWKLLLSENKPGFLASLVKAGSGIYLYIFILIVLLMVLGFIFTIYTLNGELRLNKLKSEFISNVSHELKSPLTSIRMMTEMLHQNRVPAEEQKSAYYSAMLAENERLSHLIDNILDFSRIDDERKKYDFRDLNMNELLRNYLGSIRPGLPEPDFDIRYNCPDRVPAIRADKDAMLQVIYNLVDNAIKFSGKSRQIDIDLVPQNGELRLSVRDYGIGIPVKDQEKIFDRFYRGDEVQRKRITGSGIGLTIVKKIVEAHHGEITVESEVGKGSTFIVKIPLYGT